MGGGGGGGEMLACSAPLGHYKAQTPQCTPGTSWGAKEGMQQTPLSPSPVAQPVGHHAGAVHAMAGGHCCTTRVPPIGLLRQEMAGFSANPPACCPARVI